MFEFALSAGEGTLIDYGVAAAEWLNHHINTRESVEFSDDGDVFALTEAGSKIRFRTASPDCQTGK